MKLIDRDKFISDMFDFYIENRWNPRDIHFSLLDVRGNIDSPEFEVKAIPIERIEMFLEENYSELGYVKKEKAISIEWIKKYASMKSFNDEMACYWHFWEEDVLKMVEDWETENE